MAADQNTARVAQLLRQYVSDPRTPQDVKQEIAAFMVSGTMPTSTQGQAALHNFLRGTQYVDAPGTFFMDLRSVPLETGPTGRDTPGQPVAGQAAGSEVPFYMRPTSGGTQGDNNGQNDGNQTLIDRIKAQAAAAAGGAAGAGVSAANDNGIGGGGPEGAAAQAAIAQQQANRAGIGGAGSQVTYQTPATPTGGSGQTLPGGFSGAQGQVLSEDDNRLVRFALQAAGLNPDRMNSFTRIAGKALVPLLKARRAAFGIAGDANVGGLPQDIAQFAKDFTTGGTDFFGNARQYAQGVMNSDNFRSAVGGLQDQDQIAALFQSLMPLQYAGSNPLIQQAAADTFDRQQNQFNDQIFNASGNTAATPSKGIFMDYLQGQGQNLDPITRRIFGIR